MKNKIKLEANSYELVKQDKANVVLTIEVIKSNRAEVQKELKKKADATFKALKAFSEIHSSTQSQSITDNLVQKDTKTHKWDKEGYKGVYAIALIGYDFDKLNQAIESVESLAQVSSIVTSLSNKTKADLEDKLTKQAIEAFKARAKLITASFGFKKFTINKTKVSRAQDENHYGYSAPSNAISTRSVGGSLESYDNSFYVQPRDERIVLTVSGSIVLVS